MRRTTLLGPVALITALAFGPAPASAQSYRSYPYCANYTYGSESCSFSTLAQCRAAISGVGGSCDVNPSYSGSRSNSSNRPYSPQRRWRYGG